MVEIVKKRLDEFNIDLTEMGGLTSNVASVMQKLCIGKLI